MARFPSQIIKAFHNRKHLHCYEAPHYYGRTVGGRESTSWRKTIFTSDLNRLCLKWPRKLRSGRRPLWRCIWANLSIDFLMLKALKGCPPVGGKKKDCSYFTKRSPLTLWYIRHYVKWKFKISISLLTFTSLSWSSSSNFTSQAHESCPSTLPPWVGCILSNPFVYQVPCLYWTEGLYLLEQTEVHTQNNKNKKNKQNCIIWTQASSCIPVKN